MNKDELRSRVTLIMFDVGLSVRQIAEFLTKLEEAGIEVREKETPDGETKV